MAVFGVLILFIYLRVGKPACGRQVQTLKPFLSLKFDFRGRSRYLQNGPLQVALERAIFHSCP